ncbi:MAG: hypothetical protein WAT99_07720 [Nitrospira sp.]
MTTTTRSLPVMPIPIMRQTHGRYSAVFVWLKSEGLSKAGPDTTDVKLLNDWLRKHGIKLGGSHQVGEEMGLLSPTKLTSMPNNRDHEIFEGIVHLRRYCGMKDIP